MPHFNHSLQCSWPATEKPQGSCFMERRLVQHKRPFKEVKEVKDKEAKDACVLIVRESKKVGLVG